jgi:hypothetical protein
MQGGWQPPPGGGGGYGQPPGAPAGGGYGAPPPGGPPPGGAPGGYGAPPAQPGYGGAPYGGGAPGAPPAPVQWGGYEFSEAENAVIAKTAGRAKLWGIISIVVGSLYTLSTCGAFASPTFLTNLPSGVIGIVVGIFFVSVGNALNAVVQTQGNDIQHIMEALQKMGTAFLVQIITTLVGVGLAVLVIVLMMFVFAAAAASGSM